MFIDNKYTCWYYKIINKAKLRTSNGYTEKHHIIPKSLGGDNSSSNLVSLTAREHFLCHLLLTKMTESKDKKKMIFAVFYLTGNGKANRNNKVKQSRLYQNLKEELSRAVSQQKKGCQQPPRSEIARSKYSKSKSGKKNPNSIGYFTTPWGRFESSREAAKNCPVEITSNYIIKLCTINNNKPISFLSVCRSKAYLTTEHVGKKPSELGFRFDLY